MKRFRCLSVSVGGGRPHQLLITKVKKFGDSSSFTRRSRWTVEQLRQVNGIDPNKVSFSINTDFKRRHQNRSVLFCACVKLANRLKFIQLQRRSLRYFNGFSFMLQTV